MTKEQLKARNEKCKKEKLCFISLKPMSSESTVSSTRHDAIKEDVEFLSVYYLPSR